MTSDAMNLARQGLHRAEGDLMYHLELFGDFLAERADIKEHTGIEAVRYYLMVKHNWLPKDVRALSGDDLRFAISQEMSGWSVRTKTDGLDEHLVRIVRSKSAQ